MCSTAVYLAESDMHMSDVSDIGRWDKRVLPELYKKFSRYFFCKFSNLQTNVYINLCSL